MAWLARKVCGCAVRKLSRGTLFALGILVCAATIQAQKTNSPASLPPRPPLFLPPSAGTVSTNLRWLLRGACADAVCPNEEWKMKNEEWKA